MITGKRKTAIKGFEQYAIAESGVIYNLRTYVPQWNHFETIKPRVDRGGYYSLRLCREGKTYTKFLHRLLAEAFIPNPLGLPEVNHKNGSKLDCSLPNLEWTDHRGNVVHAYEKGLNSAAKKVLNRSTGEVYLSIREAADAVGMNYNTCCKKIEKKDPTFSLVYLR